MSDEIRKALFALADRIEEAKGEPISITTAAAHALRAALAQKPTPAVPDGWQLVPVERIRTALEAVQNAMLDAYSNAYQECCGRWQDECCGDPDAAWSAEDQHIMNALSPAQRELSALLATAPAAPVVREPVAFVSQETFSSDGTSDILTRNLPVGTALYAAPPAAEQPDADRGLFAELYQILGALGATKTVLDQVLAASHGDPLPHTSLLPYAAEIGRNTE